MELYALTCPTNNVPGIRSIYTSHMGKPRGGYSEYSLLDDVMKFDDDKIRSILVSRTGCREIMMNYFRGSIIGTTNVLSEISTQVSEERRHHQHKVYGASLLLAANECTYVNKLSDDDFNKLTIVLVRSITNTSFNRDDIRIFRNDGRVEIVIKMRTDKSRNVTPLLANIMVHIIRDMSRLYKSIIKIYDDNYNIKTFTSTLVANRMQLALCRLLIDSAIRCRDERKMKVAIVIGSKMLPEMATICNGPVNLFKYVPIWHVHVFYGNYLDSLRPFFTTMDGDEDGDDADLPLRRQFTDLYRTWRSYNI